MNIFRLTSGYNPKRTFLLSMETSGSQDKKSIIRMFFVSSHGRLPDWCTEVQQTGRARPVLQVKTGQACHVES
jgi:hypothetical protein